MPEELLAAVVVVLMVVLVTTAPTMMLPFLAPTMTMMTILAKLMKSAGFFFWLFRARAWC